MTDMDIETQVRQFTEGKVTSECFGGLIQDRWDLRLVFCIPVLSVLHAIVGIEQAMIYCIFAVCVFNIACCLEHFPPATTTSALWYIPLKLTDAGALVLHRIVKQTLLNSR